MNQETTKETTQAETQAIVSAPVSNETSPQQPMLPGMEELAAENETLKAEMRIQSAAYDIETRLAAAGARSPKLLAERAKESFLFSDEGDLTNAEAVVEHLRRTWPEQFAPVSIDAAAGRTERPTLTKEALQRMTPAEIKRLDWAEVRATLASWFLPANNANFRELFF